MFRRGRPYSPEDFRAAAERDINADAGWIVAAAESLLSDDGRPPVTDIAAACEPELDAYSATPATLLTVAMHGTGKARADASAHFFDLLKPYLDSFINKQAERMCEAAEEKRKAAEEEAYCSAIDAHWEDYKLSRGAA